MHMSKQTNIRETLPDIRTLYWFQVYNTDQVRAYLMAHLLPPV